MTGCGVGTFAKDAIDMALPGDLKGEFGFPDRQLAEVAEECGKSRGSLPTLTTDELVSHNESVRAGAQARSMAVLENTSGSYMSTKLGEVSFGLGGYYELEFWLGNATAEQIRRAIVALWSLPGLDGCYLEKDRITASQRRIAPEVAAVESRGWIYGNATLPDGHIIACGTHCSGLKDEAPTDFVYSSTPLLPSQITLIYPSTFLSALLSRFIRLAASLSTARTIVPGASRSRIGLHPSAAPC
jgi:hypothetical protein